MRSCPCGAGWRLNIVMQLDEDGSGARAHLRALRGARRERPADQVERWPIDRLIAYAKNSRTHSEAQIAQLAASMKEWGWTNPVLADEAGGVIAGACSHPGGAANSASPRFR